MTTIEWMMLAAFVAALGISLWKVYAFLPNTPLHDDDTTEEATQKLTALMVRCIVELGDARRPLDTQSLFECMRKHEAFDREHFWRFNPNRLNRLIVRYFTLHPHVSSLEHIYRHEREETEATPRS